MSLDFPHLYESKLKPYIKEKNLQSKVIALDDVRHGYTTNPNYDARFIYSDSCDYILLGTNHINQARTFNPEIDRVENEEIYKILENSIATKEAGIEVIYENISYFHQIRVLKTNNKY